MSDPLWLVGSVDAVQRVPVVRVQVNPASAHRIVSAAFNIVGKRAEPPLLTLRRRPGLAILASDRLSRRRTKPAHPRLRSRRSESPFLPGARSRENAHRYRLRSSPALPSGEIERFVADRRGESMPAGRAGSPAAGGRMQCN